MTGLERPVVREVSSSEIEPNHGMGLQRREAGGRNG